MFAGQPVLFAHREGRLLETFVRGFPPIEVLGVDTDEGGPGIDTLRMAPPVLAATPLKRFAQLLEQFRGGIEHQDARAIGAVASTSAEINQRYLPTRGFGELQQIACDSGAVGLQVAHSGTVAGLLFDARDRYRERGMASAASGLKKAGIKRSYRFSVG